MHLLLGQKHSLFFQAEKVVVACMKEDLLSLICTFRDSHVNENRKIICKYRMFVVFYLVV